MWKTSSPNSIIPGITDGDKRDAVLSNAPKSADGFFVVPKVVE